PRTLSCLPFLVVLPSERTSTQLYPACTLRRKRSLIVPNIGIPHVRPARTFDVPCPPARYIARATLKAASPPGARRDPKSITDRPFAARRSTRSLTLLFCARRGSV